MSSLMSDGAWISMFSGGKDSSWTVYRALEEGLNVERLVTVNPMDESTLYHVPATELAELAAESIGIPLVTVDPTTTDDDSDANVQPGLEELWPLQAVFSDIDETVQDGLAGITIGTIENGVAANILEREFEKMELDLYAPLWRQTHVEILREMLHAGLEIRIVEVDSEYVDRSWLGRTLDREMLDTIQSAAQQDSIHLLGEGNEFETIVTDGPHMDRPIELETQTVWEDGLGRQIVHDAWLG